MNDEGLDGAACVRMVSAACRVVRERQDWLSELDAACGDGDHGVSMGRGFRAVEEQLPSWSELAPGALLRKVGMTLVSAVGGATGPLLGTFFTEAGKTAGDCAIVDTATLAAMVEAGTNGVCRRGNSQAGEKTMVDALTPAVAALMEAAAGNAAPAAALESAAKAALAGAEATVGMIALQGKARYLGERALGHPDPGAHSVALILGAFADAAGGKG